MSRFMMRFTLLVFASVSFTLTAQMSFADTLSEDGNALVLTCENPADCQAVCGASSCEVAKLTCEGCAKSSDPGLYAIFRSFHTVYETVASSGAEESLVEQIKKRKLSSKITAIAADSALDVFSDPFDPSEITKVENSFAYVCGNSGRNYVLAENTGRLVPRGVICETAPGAFVIRALKYRDDYFKEQPAAAVSIQGLR
ncbi:MAG: hypothetical protein V4692_02745 [Bdellovibrionota bacterium]